MVVTLSVESFGEEVVGELASLGKAVDAFADFEACARIVYLRMKSSGMLKSLTRKYS